MCIAVMMFNPASYTPLVLCFNRDEKYSRQWLMPDTHWENKSIFAGKDLEAGGTWLGANSFGIVAGIINKEMRNGLKATKIQSRGNITTCVLQYPSIDKAIDWIKSNDLSQYRAFNLLLFSAQRGFIITNYINGYLFSPHIIEITQGIYMVSKTGVNDMMLSRIKKNLMTFKKLDYNDMNTLQYRLTNTETEMVLNTKKWGTISVSIITIIKEHLTFYVNDLITNKKSILNIELQKQIPD